MKLYYYKPEIGNFGDDLNSFFWDMFCPNYTTSNKADWLIGIGSIFTGKINDLPGKKMVMGSGYWPSSAGKPDLNKCVIGFVRGPLTCHSLNLPENLAVSDPAILIRQNTNWEPIEGNISFIPHHLSDELHDCRKISEYAQLKYVSPASSVEAVIKHLESSSLVLTEAMHGAIIADAIGVPWKRVSFFNKQCDDPQKVDFKWADWGRSLNIDTSPSLENLLPWPGKNYLSKVVKRSWIEVKYKSLAKELRRISLSGNYNLSDRKLLTEKIDQIYEKLDEVV